MTKRRNLIDSIMYFLLHNSFMFTVVIMCFVHAALLVLTIIAGVRELVYFNIFSVIIYLICIVLCKFGHILPVYAGIFFEVTCYSVTAVKFIGWNSGSYNFQFSIAPILIFFGSYTFKGKKQLIIVLALVIDFLTYALMYIMHWGATPVYELSNVMRTIMMLFSSFVMYFSVIFYGSIYIYSSELEKNRIEMLNEKLSMDAKEDSLTGLLNRRGFIPIVADLMKQDCAGHFCIAFCDLDNFKRVNDSYGHDCGDEVLKHISRILKRELPECDICRWGGEEMVILLNEYSFNTARKKLDNIRKIIESTPTKFYNKRINVTITIGLEEYSQKYVEPEEIIKVADERMYYGKQHGKNVLVCA